MTADLPITKCVDCNETLPIAYQLQNLVRCPGCQRKFIAMSHQEREKANRKVAERFRNQ